ncbi:MAG: GH92 family glycosyl hydrolase [Bacteroidota bacterium]
MSLLPLRQISLWKAGILVLLFTSHLSCQSTKESTESLPPPLTQQVNPYVGTDGHGHVFLGANVPFGAVQLGPSNFLRGWDWCSGYHYSDSLLVGFSHQHLSGTGIGDLGDVVLMPFTGAKKPGPGSLANPEKGYATYYSHADEKVAPGYYALRLPAYQISVELTASERVGLHRYQFPASDSAHLGLDLGFGIGWDAVTESGLEQLDDTTLVGYRYSTGWSKDQRLFFAVRLSRSLGTWEIRGEKGRGGVASFSTRTDSVLLVKVGLSPVSSEQALANMQAEIPSWEFDAVRERAETAWQQQLNKVKVETRDPKLKRTFYTALYHSMFAPALFNDHDRTYRGTDKEVYVQAPFDQYTVFSLWDTYRAAHPLMTILHPERVDHMVRSFLSIDAQQGKLPVWHLMGSETNTMVGYHAVPVMVDAVLKGLSTVDPEQVFLAVKNTSMRDERGLDHVKQRGYIPAELEVESVAKALEYAIDDACIAILAEHLGKTEEAVYYRERAQAYRHYFDEQSRFMRGKMADGSWRIPFNPIASSHRKDDYCEGNAWQYTWLVPQDVEGLISLFGGEEPFVQKLDSLFSLPSTLEGEASPDISGLIGQYAQGNEPGHHIPYLYAFAGQPWKTAEKVRQITGTFFSDQADGLCGNEDCGQMSAWYIFSALGFYPVHPANGIYVLGSPLFDRVEMVVGEGKRFVLQTQNNSPENIYIQSIRWNKAPYAFSYLTHEMITGGGLLEIEMGPAPHPTFGVAKEARPHSTFDREG